MSFDSLGLLPALLRAINDAGYTQPSPVQAQAIPAALDNRDILAAAQTGTGKTAGFALPILQRIASHPQSSGKRHVRALVLTPTRELAAQVHESIESYARYLSPRVSSDVVFGGVKINPQIERLSRGVDILVACPGRLLDLVGQKAISLSQIETLVLDEADRMLDMGFLRDIRKILALLPRQRQNLLFSATFSEDIRGLTDKILVNPVKIEVAPRNSAASTVDQSVYQVEKSEKIPLLIHLIKQHDLKQVLVFTATKHMANRVTQRLERAGISAAAIHGNKSQNARTAALSGFKSGIVEVLVATDVAARGIDIAHLPNVINFELPKAAPDYVHRIGRTGRAGASGQAVSLVSPDERKQLKQIERLIHAPIHLQVAEGFDPAKILAEMDTQVSVQAPHSPNAKQGNAARKPRAANRRRSGGNNSGKNGNKGHGENKGNERNRTAQGKRVSSADRNKQQSSSSPSDRNRSRNRRNTATRTSHN